MKFKLEACRHARTVPYGFLDDGTGTCVYCYRRLRWQRDGSHVDDKPPGLCDHTVARSPITPPSGQKTTDVICRACGRALRHPDGKGEWTEIRSYCYVIHEEQDTPWSSP